MVDCVGLIRRAIQKREISDMLIAAVCNIARIEVSMYVIHL